MTKNIVPQQLVLDLGVKVERVVGGVEMGVLDNGIAYLTQRGLAIMSGAARRTIQELSEEWIEAHASGEFISGRIAGLYQSLQENGFDEPSLYITITKDGSPTTLTQMSYAWLSSNILPLMLKERTALLH